MSCNSILHEFQCSKCSTKFEALDELTVHKEQCQTNNNFTKNKNSTKKKHICQDCGSVFKYLKVLRRHRASHETKYNYCCLLCPKQFKTAEERNLHKIEQHPNKIKKSKCKLCPELSFDTKEEKVLHTRTIHKGHVANYFMCSECGRQFKTKNELTHHIKSKCGTIKQFLCKVCGQSLMTAGSLYNHMLRHTGKRSHMCNYCGKLFLTTGQLKVHERTHTQEKAFICNVCNKGFCHRQSLITHSTLHTGVKPFECENCNLSYSCVGNLMKHRRTYPSTCGAIPLTTHRVNNPSTKHKIKINTPENSKLKAYNKEKELQSKLIAYEEKLGKLKCEENDLEKTCNENNLLSTESFYQVCDSLHKLDKSELDKTTLNKEDSSVEKFEFEENNGFDEMLDSDSFNSVSICETYQNLEIKVHIDESISYNIEKHQRDLRSPNTLEVVKVENVNDCNNKDEPLQEEISKQPKKVKRKKKLKGETTESIKGAHLAADVESKCGFCNKTYTNKRWLKKHEEKHQNENLANDLAATDIPYNFKCKYCSNSFQTRDLCKIHQKMAHIDILTCQQCGKVFSNKETLRSHQNIFHKGQAKKVYTYVCKTCGLQFRQKSFLVFHENSNCGEGPTYKCYECGKGFTSIHILKSHLRIHDPKKIFLCKFCGKSFRWKGQLKIHERSHTGEKPFKCLYCPKAFAYRESLLTHSSLHTGIKPHLCKACGSRFSCVGNLIKHRVTHATSCGVWYEKNK